jgi:hypothetical protein
MLEIFANSPISSDLSSVPRWRREDDATLRCDVQRARSGALKDHVERIGALERRKKA